MSSAILGLYVVVLSPTKMTLIWHLNNCWFLWLAIPFDICSGKLNNGRNVSYVIKIMAWCIVELTGGSIGSYMYIWKL